MTRKRFFVLCLAVVTVLSCVGMASCADKGDEKDGRVTNGPVVTEVETDDNYRIDLPEENYRDKEFKVLCVGGTDAFWANDGDFFREEDSDDPVNSANYLRIQKMAETYGVKVTVYATNNTTSTLHNSIQSNDRAYQAVFARMGDIASSAAYGDLMDLHSAENMNLDNHYWDQSSVKQLSIADKLYYVAGDILITEDKATWTMMFNKKLAAANDLPDLYDLVKNRQWTLDKFKEIISKDISKESGDGIWDHLDTYAFATHRDNAFGFFYSCGLSFVTKDATDIPALNTSTEAEKIQDVLERTVDIAKNNNLMLNAHDWVHVNPQAHLLIADAFTEDRALFFAEVLGTIISFRSMDTDFGIIPLPKYNEAQPNYTTFVNPAGSLIGIPKSEGDADGGYFASYALEAMAYEGYKTVTPQFIEKAIKGKGTRDEESIEMLEIILQNRTYDLGLIANYGKIADTYNNLVFSGKTDFASAAKRVERSALREITTFITDVTEEK